MITLLTFLIRYCSRLFEQPGFKFRDSGVGRNQAEGSYILLESDEVQIYLCNERDEITWQISSMYDSHRKNWFSFDLIAQLLGYEVGTGVMDTVNSELLLKNLDKIIVRFGKGEALTTLAKLSELKAARAKRI
jgi:hypothetical protein